MSFFPICATKHSFLEYAIELVANLLTIYIIVLIDRYWVRPHQEYTPLAVYRDVLTMRRDINNEAFNRDQAIRIETLTLKNEILRGTVNTEKVVPRQARETREQNDLRLVSWGFFFRSSCARG